MELDRLFRGRRLEQQSVFEDTWQFIHREHLRICTFMVQDGIEAHDFFLTCDAEAHHKVNHFNQDKRPDSGEDPRGKHPNGLQQQLVRIPVEQAVCTGRIYRHGGKESGCKSTPGTADAVAAESIQCIVVAKFLFIKVTAK